MKVIKNMGLLLIILFAFNSMAKTATKTFNLNLDSKDIASQSELLSQIYNKPIIMNPSIKDRLLTINAKNVSPEEAKHLIAKALSLNSVAIIESPTEVSFIMAREASKSGIEVFRNKIPNLSPERMITMVLDVPSKLSVVDLEKTLRSMYSGDGELKVVPKTNQIIITDWTSNVARIQDVISKSEKLK